jgi:hypothetical protein
MQCRSLCSRVLLLAMRKCDPWKSEMRRLLTVSTSPRILIWSRRDDYRSKAVMPLESMEIPPRPPASFLFRLPIPTRLGFILREPDSVSWFPEDVVLRWVRIISSLWPVSWLPVFWRPLLLWPALSPWLLPWLWPVSPPLWPEPSRGSLFWQGPLPRP